MPHSIVVAADFSIVRKGIVSMLGHDAQLKVIAESEDGAQTIVACRQLQPDVLILALWLPRLADLAVTRLLATDPHAPRILLLDEQADAVSIHAALDAGAAGLVPASVGGVELCAAVHRVLAGEVLVPACSDPVLARPIVLGSQERLILSKVAEGQPNKAIA